MTNRELIRYVLDYTMDWSISQFEAIPDDLVWVPPRTDINAPGWIFGHVAVTERCHVGMFLQAIDDIPQEWLRVFRSHSRPSDSDLQAVAEPKSALISYWREVRDKTCTYLDGITDEDLCRTPEKSLHPEGHPNRGNTILEWFTMTIQHQNEHRGQLDIIRRLAESGQ